MGAAGMKAMLPSTTLALALAGGLVLGACAPTINNHGYQIDPELLSQITPGVTSREQVARILGSPSSMATFDDDSWYYISQRTERMSFYQNRVTAQDVVAISFDRSGIVASVEQHGMDEAMPIQPVADATPTLGNELTLIQQFLGNLGRFNSDPNAALGRNAPGP
jgi:outer membrane protein assembly factor BamE (lipoprotein component of BamABCDE complex)